ncbi:diguanylate cyclase domain-containing protein [Roseovarius sp. D0-M9]|uniref:diguanylate cyclase domain-containing protein n=1 Tax=Roseovarius sp. D0-M9 TaxID=3127117 RepID=UPI00300FF9ED
MPDLDKILQSTLLDLIDSTDDTILILASKGIDQQDPCIVYVNPAFCRMSGYSKDEIIGKTRRILQGPGTCKYALARIEAAIKGGKGCREDLLNYAKDGTPYWFDTHIVPLHTNTDDTKYFGAIQRDITEKQSAFEDLERIAHQDILTGIANRAALQQHIDNLSDETGITPEKPFMLMFDMDGFKDINDTLGHIAGDRILRHFAEYVTSILGPDDFLARLGGDEFVAILQGYTQESALFLAEQAVANLASKTVCGADKIGVSVGMTLFRPGDELECVIAHADTALYRAKNAGKGTVRIHTQTPAQSENVRVQRQSLST